MIAAGKENPMFGFLEGASRYIAYDFRECVQKMSGEVHLKTSSLKR